MTSWHWKKHHNNKKHQDYAKKGAIKGRISFDDDCDDTQVNTHRDDNEHWFDEGVAGLKVELLDKDGHVVATTHTDHNGKYHFRVDAGKYRIRVEQPDDKVFAKKDVGHWQTDSDVNEHGVSDFIRVHAGRTVRDIDVSLKEKPAGAISGRVFCDIDCDGVDGTTSTSTEDGKKYILEAEHFHERGFHDRHAKNASGGEIIRLDHFGGHGRLEQKFKGHTGTYDVSLFIQDENDGQSEIKVKVDGHEVSAFKLDRDNNGGGNDNGHFSEYVIRDVHIEKGDKIRIEVDGDGHELVRFDRVELIEQKVVTTFHPEPGKEGVEVKLVDAEGDVIATTRTDAEGGYSFTDVPVGDYRVIVTAPDGTEFTAQDVGQDDRVDSDVDAAGVSGVVTVRADETAEVDAGLKEIKLGSISGRYFCDLNDNDRDDNEPGVVGAQVFLLRDGTELVSVATTDDNGEYIFEGLEAGSYLVRFQNPDVIFGSEGKVFVAPDVGDDIDDSDVTSVGGVGNGNADIFALGAGENKENVDAGIEDPGTASIAGRYFCDENDNDRDDNEPGIVGAKVFLLLNGTELVDVATTDETGAYRFEGLAAGRYLVRFQDPAVVDGATGKVFVNPDVGDDIDDSDVTSVGGAGNGNADLFDLGVAEKKENVDAGIEDPGTASISGRAFCDDDCDGIEDDGEAGLGGVSVDLIDVDGNIAATTMTADDGTYSFTSLFAGEYQVRFQTDGIPGNILTEKDQGDDDTRDSDADPHTGETMPITLHPGRASENNDAGYKAQPSQVKGRVFLDSSPDRDCNGIEDAGEAGLAGIVVDLLDSAGNVVSTTTTDHIGEYCFEDVASGDYRVAVTSDNTLYAFAQPNQGDDDTVDSDITTVNLDGIGLTDVFSVPAGSLIADIDAALCDICIDACIDFEEFHAGDVVKEISVGGVTAFVTVDGDTNSDPNDPDDDAVIFDTDNVTGDDADLVGDGTNGNVLILTEDDVLTDPDDAAQGGVIAFEFDTAVDLTSLTVIDANEGTTIRVNGDTSSEIVLGSLEDGEQLDVDLTAFDDAMMLEVIFTGSGAIDDLKFHVCDPALVDGLVPTTA